MFHRFASSALVFALVLSVPLAASAQDPAVPPPPGSADAGPAQGLALQIRIGSPALLGAQSLLSPAFTLGYRTENITIGVGVLFSGVSASVESDDTSGLLIGAMVVGSVQLWQSPDLRTRVDATLGAGFASASLTITDTFDDGTGPVTEESNASATLIPVLVGVGGDHFLVPTFGIGAEIGFQGAFVTGVSVDDEDLDTSLSAYGLTAVLRFTFVFA